MLAVKLVVVLEDIAEEVLSIKLFFRDSVPELVIVPPVNPLPVATDVTVPSLAEFICDVVRVTPSRRLSSAALAVTKVPSSFSPLALKSCDLISTEVDPSEPNTKPKRGRPKKDAPKKVTKKS